MKNTTYKLQCAHCGSGVKVRTSCGLHPHLRIMYVQCQGCGWKGIGELTMKFDIARPAYPNEEALLPLAPAVVYREALKQAAPQNHQMDLLE